VFGWGNGQFGMIGNGSDKTEYNPVLLTALENVEVQEIRAGKTISACIDSQGNIYTWGKPLNVHHYHPGTPWQRESRVLIQPV
jgi:alpha-tubulin suppressor-like RCC1 family protein